MFRKVEYGSHKCILKRLFKTLAKEYLHSFPRSYKEDVIPGSTVADIELIEVQSDENRLGMLF